MNDSSYTQSAMASLSTGTATDGVLNNSKHGMQPRLLDESKYVIKHTTRDIKSNSAPLRQARQSLTFDGFPREAMLIQKQHSET